MDVQQDLPLAEAEGSYEERRQRLGLALIAVECDAALAKLCEWVFNVTKGGKEGELEKSYKQLGQRPWGLCCGETKARTTVARAVDEGLLIVKEHRYCTHGQKANSYEIDWDGITALLTARAAGPGVARRQGGVARRQGGVARRQPFKEQPFFSPSFQEPGPVPEKKPGPGRAEAESEKAERWLCQFPELVEARKRTIEPRPLGAKMRGSVFHPLRERNLSDTAFLANWHSRQLSHVSPVSGDTEADLILVVAAGIYATRVGHDQVKRNRVALFCDTVLKRLWQRVSRYIPDAAEAVDRFYCRTPAELQ